MQAKAMLYCLPLLLAILLPLPAVAQTTHIVNVMDNFFSPASLTIQVGDTVEWRNAAGGNSHNVTANDGSFASTTASSFTFSVTFNSAGSNPYRCTVHAGMTGTITVEGAGGDPADLAMQSVDATSGTYAPGAAIPIAISIQNIGGEASGSYSVSYYASTDSNITGADTLLGSNNRASLTAGAVANFAANAAFPGNMPDGMYFIGAIINLNDANNANNTGVDNSPVTVEAPQAQADLALNEVSAPSGSFPQGATISVDAEVENVGDAASGAFSIDFYASTNTSITTQDRLLGTQNRAGLNPGEDSSGPFNVMIPGNLAPGTYFIGGIIDVNDANNANNVNHDNQALTVTEAGGNGFLINEGLNDSWFNPATGGQGFFITVFPDIEMMFLAWFTYDVERPPGNVSAMLGEPGHRWLTAFGPYAGDTAMLEVELTQGGVFDASPPAPTQGPDGTMTVVFSDCNTAEVTYNITSAQVSGEVPIRRIANDNIPFCESLAAP
jgi:plastocyanin